MAASIKNPAIDMYMPVSYMSRMDLINPRALKIPPITVNNSSIFCKPVALMVDFNAMVESNPIELAVDPSRE